MQVKFLQVDQLSELAVRNNRDVVVAELEFDKFCAHAKAFDGHNFIETKLNLLYIQPGLIKPFNLGYVLVLKFDHSRFANTFLVVSHLYSVGTRVILSGILHMLVPEDLMNQFHLESYLWHEHSDH